MAYLQLESISHKHVVGTWDVQECFNVPVSGGALTGITSLHFDESGEFTADGHNPVSGSWELFRENEIIYNPQLRFLKDDAVIASAIITRLSELREDNIYIATMTIYFTNGMEFIIQKAEIFG